MQVYVNNIVKDPENPKYRKIRISNPKFNTVIWQLEQARTFLLFSGFEQEGDFLVLPSSVKLDEANLLIDEALGLSPSSQTSHHANSGPSHSSHTGNVLKLSSQKGESLFDQDAKADLTLLSYMKEMGYDISVAEKALIATKNKGIQPAIDWINQNPGEAAGTVQKEAEEAKEPQSDTQSTKQHSVASSSSVDPAPVSRYQKTIDERHKFQERLRLEAIEEAKLEKQRKKLHKEYLLKDMKDEKDEKMEKAKQAKLTEDASEPLNRTVADQEGLAEGTMMVDLRIRLPDGQLLSVSLSSDSTIETLYQEVNRLWPLNDNENAPDFVLLTSFPQRRISDMESTLDASGLAPRAALVVQRADQQGVLTQGEGAVVSVRNITKIDEWQEVLSEQDKLLVVQFYASWCSLCRSVSDSYDSLNAKYGMNGQVVFARVNVDELKVLKYQQAITSLPTFKLFWSGQAITQVEGTNMAELEQQIKENLSGPRDVPQEEPPGDEMYFDPR